MVTITVGWGWGSGGFIMPLTRWCNWVSLCTDNTSAWQQTDKMTECIQQVKGCAGFTLSLITTGRKYISYKYVMSCSHLSRHDYWSLKLLQGLHLHFCMQQNAKINWIWLLKVLVHRLQKDFAKVPKSPPCIHPPTLQSTVTVSSVAAQEFSLLHNFIDVIEVAAAFLCRRRGKTRPSATIFGETACMVYTQA